MQHNIKVVAVVLLVGGISFYGGFSFGKSKASTLTAGGATINEQLSGARGAFGGGSRGGSRAGFLTGDIIAKDDMSITVKMRVPQNASSSPSNVGVESGSKIIFFSGTTDIGKQTKGSTDDLTTGETVTVMGTPNSDGSLTANSIQIRSDRAGFSR